MDVKKLCNVIMTCKRIFFAEGRPDSGRLLLYESAFVGNSLKIAVGLDRETRPDDF